MFKNKTFGKENHIILEQTKLISLATTISIYLSFISNNKIKNQF